MCLKDFCKVKSSEKYSSELALAIIFAISTTWSGLETCHMRLAKWWHKTLRKVYISFIWHHGRHSQALRKVPSTVVMISWHWVELFDPLKLQGLPNLSSNRGPNYQESQVLRWATHQKDAKSSLIFKKFLPFVSEDQLIIWWTRLSLKETLGSFTGF